MKSLPPRQFRRYARDGIIYLDAMLKRISKSQAGKRVLCFHEIDDGQAFRLKMEWLKQDYELVSLATLLTRSPQEKSMLALTFDDGYASWHDVAAPILQALHIPATFFICSGFVGLQRQAAALFIKERLHRERDLIPLTKSQLLNLANCDLFEIGGHTIHHYDLGQWHNSPSLSQHEIHGDRQQLQDWIGHDVRWFAYPFGMKQHISAEAVSFIQQLGFAGAYTLSPDFFTQKSHPFLIGRDGLDIHASARLWQAWLAGGYDRWYHIKESRKHFHAHQVTYT